MADGLLHLRQVPIDFQAAQITETLNGFTARVTASILIIQASEVLDADGLYPAQNDGGDIRFSDDAAGTTIYACEVIEFSTNNDPLLATCLIDVHVTGSISSIVNTRYWMHYHTVATDSQPAITAPAGRNASWDNNFIITSHYEEDPGGVAPQMVDSTGNGNDGTTTGMTVANQVASALDALGNGLDFNSATTVVKHGTDASLRPTAAFTLEAWINADTWPGFARIIDMTGVSGAIDSGFRLFNNNNGSYRLLCKTALGTAEVQFGGVPAAGVDVYIFAKWDSANLYAAINNEALTVGDAMTDIDYGAGTSEFQVGSFDPSSNDFDGKKYEIRFSNIDRSEGYRLAHYTNVTNPTAFMVTGVPQDVAGAPTNKTKLINGGLINTGLINSGLIA